jgi:hypothetical protein
MGIFGSTLTLRGEYRGHRDAGIEFFFRFDPDGERYQYVCRLDGSWEVAQSGYYRIRQSPRPEWSALVQFTPIQATEPRSAMALHMLAERGLLAYETQAFLVRTNDLEQPALQFISTDPAAWAADWMISPT